MMNNEWLVNATLKLLSGLPQRDAEAVLFDVKQRLEAYQPVAAESEKTVFPNGYRKLCRSKIDRDLEVKEFILGLPYMVEAEILLACRERFGTARTPSRSGLNRFLIALRKVK